MFPYVSHISMALFGEYNFKKYHHFQTKPYAICFLLRSIEVQLEPQRSPHHLRWNCGTWSHLLGAPWHGWAFEHNDSGAISGLNIMIHHDTSVSQKSFHVWFLKRVFFFFSYLAARTRMPCSFWHLRDCKPFSAPQWLLGDVFPHGFVSLLS